MNTTCLKRIFGFLLITALLIVAVYYLTISKLMPFDTLAIVVFAGIPLIGIFFALLLFGDHKYERTDDFAYYYARRTAYLKLYVVWLVVYYWLVSLSFFAPAFLSIIAAYGDTLDPSRIVTYSLVSIFGTMLNAILKPSKLAYGYRISFELLEKELRNVIRLSKDEAEPILQNALKTSERSITHATFGTFDTDKYDR